ncbi:unnamed protein product [Mesocestoides corti]|uniref:Uncharacterized protein n=1 Tax=Mesocestoides corti TaxID=53468 RepID=A0A3P6HKK5_MESCO|nr:unnamed protein product [Mesocestoides corti]
MLTAIALLLSVWPCGGWLRLDGDTATHRRYARQYEAPEISMRAVSPHWINIQCTIPRSSSGFKVFIICPALDAPCYENCQPTQTCPDTSVATSKCLPDRSAVNCSQVVETDGRTVVDLWIDKRNSRLHGPWVCSSLGVKSSVVNVSIVSTNIVLSESKDAQALPPPLPPPPPPPPQPPQQATPNTTEATPLEDLKGTFPQADEGEKPSYYAFASRRRKYNEDQKTLGDMICLPTNMSRTHSGLWEHDVYPSNAGDALHNSACFDEPSSNFQRFGTFGPNTFYFDQPQQQVPTTFTDLAFPQYFSTMQPNQLWRTRSAAATVFPSTFSAATGRRSRLRSGTGSLHHVPSQRTPLIDNSPLPPPPPPPALPIPTPQTSKEPRRFPRITMSPTPPAATVYDDVASSSTITVISRDGRKPATQMAPQLPSMAEFDLAPKTPNTTSIYTAHTANPYRSQMETFRSESSEMRGVDNDADILNH